MSENKPVATDLAALAPEMLTALRAVGACFAVFPSGAVVSGDMESVRAALAQVSDLLRKTEATR